MAVIATIVIAAVGAIAAGAQTYMQMQAASRQAREQSRMAAWQRDVELAQAEAARKQVRLKAQRLLNAQGAKAGAAGVVAGEGSLLVNQLEAASLAQYEEDLAAYGHVTSASTRDFESKLLRSRAKQIDANMPLNVGLSLLGSAASSYGSYTRGRTVSTGADVPYTSTSGT